MRIRDSVQAPFQRLSRSVLSAIAGIAAAAVSLAAQALSPEPARQDPLNHWSLLATIIGVVGGLIGIGLIFWQSVLLRRSANAAKQGAEALMNSERAWVMVDVEFIPGMGGIVDGASPQDFYKTAAITLICKNDGKTPAWVTEKRVCLRVADSLPAVPDLESAETAMEPDPL